jgi:hypothetical protein
MRHTGRACKASGLLLPSRPKVVRGQIYDEFPTTDRSRARKLLFAGKVRAGFTPHLRAVMFGRLIPPQTRRCPFVNLTSSKTSDCEQA